MMEKIIFLSAVMELFIVSAIKITVLQGTDEKQ